MKLSKGAKWLFLLTGLFAAAGCGQGQPLPDPYKVKNIEVVWQRLDVDGTTCTRCEETGVNVERITQDLQKELAPYGVKLSLTKKELSESQLGLSNMIFVNGEPVENLVAGVDVTESDCSSCGDLTDQQGIKCRAIKYKDKIYDEIPPEVIREAVLVVAKNLPRPPAPTKPPEDSSGPGCSG